MKASILKTFKSVKSFFPLVLILGCVHSLLGRPQAVWVLTWTPSPESDVAGYRVFLGESSSSYSRSVDVGFSNVMDLSSLVRDKTYFCAVLAYDKDGNESPLSDEVSFVLPSADSAQTLQAKLLPNFPNPFRDRTLFWAVQPDSGRVVLRINDVAGREVRTVYSGPLAPGVHGFVWDGLSDNGTPAASGIYFAVLSMEKWMVCRKMLLVR